MGSGLAPGGLEGRWQRRRPQRGSLRGKNHGGNWSPSLPLSLPAHRKLSQRPLPPWWSPPLRSLARPPSPYPPLLSLPPARQQLRGPPSPGWPWGRWSVGGQVQKLFVGGQAPELPVLGHAAEPSPKGAFFPHGPWSGGWGASGSEVPSRGCLWRGAPAPHPRCTRRGRVSIADRPPPSTPSGLWS